LNVELIPPLCPENQESIIAGPLGDKDEMLPKLGGYGPMNDPNSLIKADLVEVPHHHPRTERTQIAPLLGAGTRAELRCVLGKFSGIVVNGSLDFGELRLCFFLAHGLGADEDMGSLSLLTEVREHGP